MGSTPKVGGLARPWAAAGPFLAYFAQCGVGGRRAPCLLSGYRTNLMGWTRAMGILPVGMAS